MGPWEHRPCGALITMVEKWNTLDVCFVCLTRDVGSQTAVHGT